MSERRPHRNDSHVHEGEPLRLQAFLARAGVASRRASEGLIASGRVSVNGHVVTTPGTKVRQGADRVEVDGLEVAPSEPIWVALHKPKGYVTTRHDTYGRRTIYDLLPDRFHALFHVGRLDRDSEGLLLLTNDGDTANRLLHPRFGTTKEYLADVQGKASNDAIARLLRGVELEDGIARAEDVKRLHQTDVDTFRLRVVLREGKKREVRRMLDAVGHPVTRLVRTHIGPVVLADQRPGTLRVLGRDEIGKLYEAVSL